jgi:hypothetical protein
MARAIAVVVVPRDSPSALGEVPAYNRLITEYFQWVVAAPSIIVEHVVRCWHGWMLRSAIG